jgi:hypothetical protein
MTSFTKNIYQFYHLAAQQLFVRLRDVGKWYRMGKIAVNGHEPLAPPKKSRWSFLEWDKRGGGYDWRRL